MGETAELGVQNDFFNQARRTRARVVIFLASGKRLTGRIKSFDRYAVLLDAGGGLEEMIFKHAIATVSLQPTRPPQGTEPRGEHRAEPSRESRTPAPPRAEPVRDESGS